MYNEKQTIKNKNTSTITNNEMLHHNKIITAKVQQQLQNQYKTQHRV